MYCRLNIYLAKCNFVLDSQAANKASASLTDVILETHRKKHMAFLMADLGVLVDKESGKQITRDVRKKWQLSLSCVAVIKM